MSNKFIYPILIIIFSILIIYFILVNKKNTKLNNNIEKFSNSLLKGNMEHNTQFTKELVAGTWTSMDTTVNSDYTVTNLLTINPNQFYDSCNQSTNIGSIIQDTGNTSTQNCSYEYDPVYYITFILNENIVAVPGRNTSYNLHINSL